ncbi:energy transducer TonB [Fulvivirga maritima]|uniref:energy transducer TonB n=1 Tax=Fulvivirga maritima TaxID=2904247 RepID=UPI001F2AE9B7|nr:energy transducer TonB [Fulvivirga maritima]UII25328.1 energy transducer TonB [Fulvivirga maritima]
MLLADKTYEHTIDKYTEDTLNKVEADARQAQMIADLMAIKKNKDVKMKSQRILFFSIGLLVSMSFVVGLFEWKSYDSGEQLAVAHVDAPVDELLEIPPTEQAPPPPPKQVLQQPNIVEVPAEEEIEEEIDLDFDIDITTEEAIEQIDFDNTQLAQPEEEKVEEVFTIVETRPEPKMGMTDFMKFLYENIRYPKGALDAQIQGKVFVQFIVNSDGTLSDFEVLKGIGKGCDEEAVRVLKTAAPWNPGKQRGRPVKVKMVLPINFVYKERK